jgi:hypothetical protein
VNKLIVKNRFEVCIKNDGCEDLELRKIYEVLPDEKAAEDDYIRVIDESGEDYLYPAIYFYPVELPQAVQESFRIAA